LIYKAFVLIAIGARLAIATALLPFTQKERGDTEAALSAAAAVPVKPAGRAAPRP